MTSLSTTRNGSRCGARTLAMNIGIASAGLLGRLLAFELARTGHSVEVFDPASGPKPPESGPYAAGWTAAGMLSPTAELESADDNVFALGLRSLELWPGIVAALGQPVELHRRGSLLVAHRGDEGAARRVVDLLQHKAPAGHAPQTLDAAALRELEPAIPARTLVSAAARSKSSVQAMAALPSRSQCRCSVYWGVAVRPACWRNPRQASPQMNCVSILGYRGAARPSTRKWRGFTPEVRGYGANRGCTRPSATAASGAPAAPRHRSTCAP